MENPRKVKTEYVTAIGTGTIEFNKECDRLSNDGYNPLFGMVVLDREPVIEILQQWSKTTLIKNDKNG